MTHQDPHDDRKRRTSPIEIILGETIAIERFKNYYYALYEDDSKKILVKVKGKTVYTVDGSPSTFDEIENSTLTKVQTPRFYSKEDASHYAYFLAGEIISAEK